MGQGTKPLPQQQTHRNIVDTEQGAAATQRERVGRQRGASLSDTRDSSCLPSPRVTFASAPLTALSIMSKEAPKPKNLEVASPSAEALDEEIDSTAAKIGSMKLDRMYTKAAMKKKYTEFVTRFEGLVNLMKNGSLQCTQAQVDLFVQFQKEYEWILWQHDLDLVDLADLLGDLAGQKTVADNTGGQHANKVVLTMWYGAVYHVYRKACILIGQDVQVAKSIFSPIKKSKSSPSSSSSSE